MPYGTGTYGSQGGRPTKKQKMKRRKGLKIKKDK